jgi:hypothetical protein
MRELFGAGEQAVFENPDAKDKITLIERRWNTDTEDFVRAFEKIGITRQEVEAAYSRL